jgi:hypothetical protein
MQIVILFFLLSSETLIGRVNRIGFEPMACCLEGSCSIQLSYRS